MAKHPINAKVMGSISQEHTHNVVKSSAYM